MKEVRLEPKTRKGENTMRNLLRAAGRVGWEIKARQARVGFDASSGPWLLVQPVVNSPHIAAKFQRWVHANSDRNFAVHEV